jgi:hypothetical protein
LLFVQRFPAPVNMAVPGQQIVVFPVATLRSFGT